MKKILLINVCLITTLAFALIGCGNDYEVPPMNENTRTYSEKILDYYQKDMPDLVKFDDGYSAYFDISDGMEHAYKSDTTKSILEGIAQYVCGNSAKWNSFALDNEEVIPLQQLTEDELFKKIIYTANNGKYAPIKKALDSIVQSKKRSILVTDFEEYDKSNGIIPNCYAKESFEKWLSMGGLIKFYITNYKENNLNKKWFIVIFDSADKELVKKIDAHLEGRNKNYSTYLLSNTLCEATPQYGNEDGCISNNKLNGDKTNGPKHINYCTSDYNYRKMEYYIIKSSLKYLPTNCKSVRIKDSLLYTGLLSKLFVDLSEHDAYIINTLKLNVYDVTDDFNNYSTYRQALLNPPEIEQTEAGTYKTKKESKYYVKDEKTNYKYEEDSINKNYKFFLDEKYDYNLKKDSKPELLKGIFMINNNLFQKTMKEDSKNTHIAVDLDPIYQNDEVIDNIIEVPEKRPKLKDNINEAIKRIEKIKGNLLRIDICLGESEYDDNRIRNLFTFESNGLDKPNGCIYESIRMILQSDKLKPDNNVIYTYFLEFKKNSEEQE
jgi:hypothetical protein